MNDLMAHFAMENDFLEDLPEKKESAKNPREESDEELKIEQIGSASSFEVSSYTKKKTMGGSKNLQKKSTFNISPNRRPS